MNTTTVRRVKIEAGSYRLGDYVAFSDNGSTGEFDELDPVVWGIVRGDLYDRRQGDVGLPDAITELPRLRDCVEWVQSQMNGTST